MNTPQNTPADEGLAGTSGSSQVDPFDVPPEWELIESGVGDGIFHGTDVPYDKYRLKVKPERRQQSVPCACECGQPRLGGDGVV